MHDARARHHAEDASDQAGRRDWRLLLMEVAVAGKRELMLG